MILATGSVTKYIEESRLACLRSSSLSLDIATGGDGTEGVGGDKAGLTLAGGVGCGHAGNVSLEFLLPLSSGQLGLRQHVTCAREQD